MERTAPVIEIKVHPAKPVDDFPSVPIYTVETSTGQSTWLETFATPEEVRAFLRGLQAGSQMTGGPYFSVPGIPQHTN